jgi:adenine-specific DNA-methyltransferase
MPRGKKGTGKAKTPKEPKSYDHKEEHPQRPDIGIEREFKQKKLPVTYRYDSSLSPSLNWDENSARERGEELIEQILKAEDLESAKRAARKLKNMSRPFLEWTGKAEQSEFEVPTLPLFTHERLSTRAIIDTAEEHKGPEQLELFELFNDPKWSVTDQILKAYEYKHDWVNRLILGDSLVVMNSLLQYEGMGGKVQMIYIDPPYGIKFGSNFQPFVRKRDVKHNDDDSLTREPETVKAYRDTWELGLHSYLSYLRDRLLLARELLADSGSVFVQISDENVHHVREVMDEVFGESNFIRIISFRKKSMPLGSTYLEEMNDYLIWYGKNSEITKYKQLFAEQNVEGLYYWNWVELPDGTKRKMTKKEISNHGLLPEGAKVARLVSLKPPTFSASAVFPITLEGKEYWPSKGSCWISNREVMQRLAYKGRLVPSGKSLMYFYKISDYPFSKVTNQWLDMGSGNFTDTKIYVVQTTAKLIERCLLMTTDPGDLVLDLTCGSGTTAYVAEQWGRRWITCDISRVPLALARQRLLTATFPYYELKDESKGPAGGFVYKRKQNRKGEEVGGIVPHITLKSIANNEPPEEETLVDRPEENGKYVRVAGPFVVEGTIPPPADMEGEPRPETETVETESAASFSERLLRVLQQSPAIHLQGNKTVTFSEVRQPTKSQLINAEAIVEGEPVGFLFGPEDGAIAERTVLEAAREAKDKNYQHLYAIGFAIGANARQLVEHCHETIGIGATYIQATPDLLMGDLLKNMRSSQIFSVCGLPEIEVTPVEGNKYQVELLGLDVFDPTTMKPDHLQGRDVPAWFLDADYNGLCFYVRQAFFPRTSAWDSIKKALKGTYEDSVWEHLAGTVSAPFELGEHREIAVKAIDDRGNELLVVRRL